MNFVNIPIKEMDKWEYDRLSEEDKNNDTIYIVNDVEAYTAYCESLNESTYINRDLYVDTTTSKKSVSNENQFNVGAMLDEVESFVTSLVI